jgi:hypothetical protein
MTELEELVGRAVRGSLQDIEDALAAVQREPESTAARADLVMRLADALAGRDLGDAQRQLDLRERYLLATLEDPRGLPLDAEAALLDRLGDPELRDGLAEAQRAARRRRLGRAWLRALEHGTAVLGADADEEVPDLSVPPPPATGARPGTAPEAIDDPDLRAAYEADIARNRARSEAYRTRHAERLLACSLADRAEQRAIDAYAAEPAALEELREDLGVLSDEETRHRIMQAVRARAGDG